MKQTSIAMKTRRVPIKVCLFFIMASLLKNSLLCQETPIPVPPMIVWGTPIDEIDAIEMGNICIKDSEIYRDLTEIKGSIVNVGESLLESTIAQAKLDILTNPISVFDSNIINIASNICESNKNLQSDLKSLFEDDMNLIFSGKTGITMHRLKYTLPTNPDEFRKVLEKNYRKKWMEWVNKQREKGWDTPMRDEASLQRDLDTLTRKAFSTIYEKEKKDIQKNYQETLDKIDSELRKNVSNYRSIENELDNKLKSSTEFYTQKDLSWSPNTKNPILENVSQNIISQYKLRNENDNKKSIDFKSVFPSFKNTLDLKFTCSGTQRESIEVLYSKIQGANTFSGTQSDSIKIIATCALEEADSCFSNGDNEVAEKYIEISKAMLDVLTGMIPPVGFARDVYELIAGKNIVTGEELTDTDKVVALLNVATFGFGGSGKTFYSTIIKIEKKFGNKLETAIRWMDDYIDLNKKVDWKKIFSDEKLGNSIFNPKNEELFDILKKDKKIPNDWKHSVTRNENGIEYFQDGTQKANSVRIMRGNPDSPYPISKNPYVKIKRNGQWLDKNGNVVPSGNEPDAHIPLVDFEFPSNY